MPNREAMDDLACPACRGTDLIRLGLGRQRRCRKCGRVWIATELPTAPVQAHAKGTTSRSSSSRTSAGLAGLATRGTFLWSPQVRAALGRYLEVALPNHHPTKRRLDIPGAAINEGHQVPAPSLHSERLEHGSAGRSLRPDHRQGHWRVLGRTARGAAGRSAKSSGAERCMPRPTRLQAMAPW